MQTGEKIQELIRGSFEAQQAQLKAAACTKVFGERVSAVAPEREQLEAALEYAREGDVLVVTKLARKANRYLLRCLRSVRSQRSREMALAASWVRGLAPTARAKTPEIQRLR